jgi:hypothetical protein
LKSEIVDVYRIGGEKDTVFVNTTKLGLEDFLCPAPADGHSVIQCDTTTSNLEKKERLFSGD